MTLLRRNLRSCYQRYSAIVLMAILTSVPMTATARLLTASPSEYRFKTGQYARKHIKPQLIQLRKNLTPKAIAAHPATKAAAQLQPIAFGEARWLTKALYQAMRHPNRTKHSVTTTWQNTTPKQKLKLAAIGVTSASSIAGTALLFASTGGLNIPVSVAIKTGLFLPGFAQATYTAAPWIYKARLDKQNKRVSGLNRRVKQSL